MAYTPSCMHMALLQALSILLLASMLVPGSAEEAPSGYRMEPIHVDANGGFTREELIRRDVDTTHHRAAMLSFATNYSDSTYLMKLEIGTPPEPFWAVLDTGSGFVWTRQLKLCNRFASSTFTRWFCSDSTPEEGLLCPCMFQRKYGSGKTAGFMGSDKLTLSPKTTDQEVSDDITFNFGCAIDWKGLPQSAEGIVGLNRGPDSLLEQLNVKKFSYCLSNQSKLLLGNHLVPSARAKTTPLVEFPRKHSKWSDVASYKYYVELHRISIGGKHRSLEKVISEQKSKDDNGVLMFVDSGTSLTVLEKTVFDLLMDLLKELGFNEIPKSTPKNEEKESGTLLTCFQKPAPIQPSEMELTFASSAEMRLPWANYMIEYGDALCLAIEEGKAQTSILGNFQQKNITMLYDLTKGHGELSFLPPDDCSKL